MVSFLVPAALALDNGLGRTPARGWNAWNSIRCEGLNENLIREVADAMVSSGLRDAGYTYVNIDDCWMASKRSADGHLQAHPQRFPSGMKALGDYIHSRGLKFGIYSCAGHTTCEGHPASFGYEKVDAADWASWGVDYLKYDFCGLEKVPPKQKVPKELYAIMRDALNATGRPIMYSLCNWGTGGPHLWGQETGNSWRTGRDVFAVWDEHSARAVLKLPGYLQSVMTAIEDLAQHHPYAGPGGFNDPDMLVVGLEGMTPYGLIDSDDKCPPHLAPGQCKKGDYISREVWGSVGGLTHTEQRTHFAFWCALAAPLMLGNDPRGMSAATRRILMAPELLAINQDPLGKQARRVWQEGALAIWRKPLASGEDALLLFNGGTVPADITTVWARDVADSAAGHEQPPPAEAPCLDKAELRESCKGWAKDGECVKNAGYMRGSCPLSCGACPKPQYDGPVATARVYNAWDEEDEGGFIARYTAKHVESHEARVLIVGFGPRALPLSLARIERAKHRAPAGVADYPPSSLGAHAAGQGRQTRHRATLRAHAAEPEEPEAEPEREPEEPEAEPEATAPHERSRPDLHDLGSISARSARSQLDLHVRATHAAEAHLQRLSLRACTYEYGPSLLSLYVATALLAAMLVHVGRQCFRGNGLGKQPPSGGRVRVHLGEESTPRRRC